MPIFCLPLHRRRKQRPLSRAASWRCRASFDDILESRQGASFIQHGLETRLIKRFGRAVGELGVLADLGDISLILDKVNAKSARCVHMRRSRPLCVRALPRQARRSLTACTPFPRRSLSASWHPTEHFAPSRLYMYPSVALHSLVPRVMRCEHSWISESSTCI